jgi:hypothetical protein
VIGISFQPSSLQDPALIAWWTSWQKRAEQATEKIVDTFEHWLEFGQPAGVPCQHKFNSDIWTELRDWYMKHIFYKKCAYCERLISGYYGDAEHYRPKGAVTCSNGAGDLVRAACKLPDARRPGKFVTVSHPGYFWLAYDWRNLMPSCVYCNSGQGKNDRFDAKKHLVMVRLKPTVVNALAIHEQPRPSKRWPGYYYPTPTLLNSMEEPALLCPLNAVGTSNPRAHIRFGVRGIVAALDKSERGRASIDLLRLREEDLRQDRQQAQEEFADRFYDAMRSFDVERPQEGEAAKLINKYVQGQYPFSAAALDYHPILAKAQMTLMPPPPNP